MSTFELTDDVRRAVASEAGRRSGEVRRLRAAAVRRIVTATREAQGLPPTVTDVEVLDQVAALLERQVAS